MSKSMIVILMGSKSDLPVVSTTIDCLRDFGVEAVPRVLSAHRTPDEAHDFACSAEKEGIEVIIAAAGKAAHLGGVLAAYTVLPVIGLPIKSSTMDGLDSLLSIVQMPSGIPVATVAINGGENAALLAVQILAIKYDELNKKLKEFKKTMRENVLKANDALIEEIK